MDNSSLSGGVWSSFNYFQAGRDVQRNKVTAQIPESEGYFLYKLD